MKVLCLLITMTLIMSAGASNIFDILDEKYITDISELPYSSGNPDKNLQKQGHIEAWIDIVGFRNLSKENETFYSYGDPVGLAIIQNDARGVFKCSTCGYKITQYVHSYAAGNYLVSVLETKMIWYELVCTKDGCSCVEHTEFATFSDVESVPKQFDKFIDSKVNIIEYNNSVNPRTVINVSTSNLSSINYTYKNQPVHNYLKNARVEKTAKGIYFANLSMTNIWTGGTDSFQQMNDNVIIRGTADPDYDNLSILASNIYETKKVTNYSIVRDTYTIERSFSPIFIMVATIFSIMFGILYYTAKRAFS